MSRAEIGVDLTQERVRSLLSYEPETGRFRWLIDVGRGRRAGDSAGWVNPDGYHQISIGGRNYYAHRLAWLWMSGEWPVQVDHSNRNRSDNRWVNLRHATRDQNNVNKTVKSSSLSGAKGVRLRVKKSGIRFHVKIKKNGKDVHLGVFLTKEEASAAYARAAQEVFGEFACW